MDKITQKEQSDLFADWLEGKITDTALKNKVSEKDFLTNQKIKKSFEIINELNAPLGETLIAIKNNSTEKIKTNTNKKGVFNLYTKWAMSIAASLILLIGIYNNYSKSNNTIISSNFGEQKTIALLDGSEVILNAKSTLKYNKSDWKNKRELYLDGEAYFKVTKGNTFIVNTKNGSITVLGTQFNVNTKNNYFNVICYEGKVKVTETNGSHILTPNMAISTINGIQKEFTINQTKPEWTNGESTFNNVPLKFVIDELENQFNFTFDRSNIDQNTNFTGSFNNKKSKIALALVFKPMGINYKKVNSKIILSK